MIPSCPMCGQPCSVNQGHRVNKTCGKRRCFVELRRRQSIGQVPVQAHQAARAQRDQRMQAVIGFHVGPLTARDRTVFALAYRYAYGRGYAAGRAFHGKRQAA